jgi:cardiolipin synthase A/B
LIWNFQLSLRLGPERQCRDRVVCKPEKRRKAVLELIRSARQSLLLSIFRCDDVEVLGALADAVARGVDVQILITQRARGWGKKLAALTDLLRHLGAHVHPFAQSAMKYHAKFIVADGARSLIGTLNLTRKCFSSTRDYLLVTHDRSIARDLTALFWADVAGDSTPALSPRLIVGPEGTRGRIEDLLTAAKRSIYVVDHKISDPAVLSLLARRAAAGVTVEIATGRGQDGLKPHGRLIVVDGRTAVLGSFTLTRKSLDARRELAVVVSEPELVAKLSRQFQPAPAPLKRLELLPAVA